MSGVWDRVYQADETFFGEEPNSFATLCLNQMKSINVKKVLEIGAGHGRDAMFFASNGLESSLPKSCISLNMVKNCFSDIIF